MATTRTLTIFVNGREVENNLKSIRAEYTKLYNEAAKMNAGTKEYAEKVAELKRTKGILDEHRSQLSGTGKAWDTIKNGVAKASPYIAAAFTAFKTGEKIIKSAQGASDEWEASLTGLKWGLDSVMKSIATWDFSNFIENIQNSVKAGKEYAKVLDDLGDRQRSYAINESNSRIEIEKLERVRDNVLLSDEERLKAAEDIDKKEREILSQNLAIKTDAFNNEIKRIKNLTKLNDEQIKSFLKQYEAQKVLREEAEKYNTALENIEKGKLVLTHEFINAGVVPVIAPELAEEAIKNSNEIVKNASSDTKIYAEILRGIGKTTDEELGSAVKAWVELDSAELSYLQNTQRNERKINEFKKTLSNEDQKYVNEVRKRNEALSKKLEEIQYKLNQYNKAAILVEIEDTHRKYRELEKEAQGNSQAIIKIKELENQEISQINDRHKKQLADDLNKAADDFEKLLDADSKAFKDYVINNEELNQQNKDMAQAMVDEWKSKLEAEEKRDIFGMTQEDWDNLKNNFNEVAQYAGLALSTYAAYSDYLAAKDEEELRRYERSNNEKREQLENRLKAGVISEKVYNRSISNMDEDLESKRKAIANEQARREKAIRLFGSIINTAAAIVEALPNIPLSIAVGIAGAAQTALIASMKIPEYAAGGRIPKKTLLIAGEAGEEGVLSNQTLTSPSTGPLANWLLDIQQGLNPRLPTTIAPITTQVSNYGSATPIEANTQPQVVVQPTDNSELVNKLDQMLKYLSDPKNRQAYILKDIMTKDDEEENFRTSIQKLK